jgi:hypothetical protein
MMTRCTKTRKVDDGMDVDKISTSKSDASHDNKVVRFFTGAYEGRLGRVDPTRRASAGRGLVLVNMGSGVVVSVWSIARPHPDKPQICAQAVVMQKPNFEKALKALAKNYVVIGGYKKD